jgi:hypothetical protein
MVELAEIFRQHGPAYRAKYAGELLPSHLVAMKAIEQCRSAELGGELYYCAGCQQFHYVYRSCGNRHCPKCQYQAGEEWLAAQQNLLLPVPYFLITFTLPAALRQLLRSNQQIGYNLLFRASAEALQELAYDPRFVGGRIGMVGILQTWARDMSYHPHVHYLVPGGGVSFDGERWQRTRNHFFVHCKPLGILFRAKFRAGLRHHGLLDQVPASVWREEWVVDCQPVGNGETALKYLAPYVFRVAISNNRIEKLENDAVTYRYKESTSGQNRRRTLPVEEFIRRFLQHVLPKGFVKVRYYGFFAPGNRRLLAQVQSLLGANAKPDAPDEPTATALPAQSPPHCPRCGQPLRWVETLLRHRIIRAPPG